jgi:pyruvate, water dikinase
MNDDALIRTFDELGRDDVASVGGKNASLGEMIRFLADHGVPVPAGFATTAAAFRAHLDQDDLAGRIAKLLEDASAEGRSESAGSEIREAVRDTPLPDAVRDAIRSVGFCGQAPSNDASYAEFLVRAVIDSIPWTRTACST